MKKNKKFRVTVIFILLVTLTLSATGCGEIASITLETVVEEGSEKMKTLYLEEYTSPNILESDGLGIKIAGTDISEFRIVYASEPVGLDAAAFRLQSHIERSFGILLDCTPDTKTVRTEHEILIGCTDRAVSADKYAKGVAPMTYRFDVDSGQLSLVCGGAYSAIAAVEELFSKYCAGEGILLDNGVYLETVIPKLGRQELTEGCGLRVMTSNILADRWQTSARPPVAQRAEMYAGILATYRPDLIGVQETDEPWMEALPYYLKVLKRVYGIEYTWIENTCGELANMTSIIYRSDRFALTDSGSTEFSYKNSTEYKIRMLTHGVFEEKTSQKIFVLINTHWSGRAQDEATEIAEQSALVKEMQTKYPGCYLFCTGDYNIHTYVAFEPFKAASGLIDSKDSAIENGTLVNLLPGNQKLCYTEDGQPVYIDHVFTNLPVGSIRRYETVNKNLTSLMSDHLPQYCDYVLP